MVRTRAERRLAKELEAAGKAEGTKGTAARSQARFWSGKGKGTSVSDAIVAPPTEKAPTLAELGLPRRAQRPRAKFEGEAIPGRGNQVKRVALGQSRDGPARTD